MGTIIGIVVGSAVTWWIALFFFKRSASKEGESRIMATQAHHTTMLEKIYENTVRPSERWYAVDISQYVPSNVAKAVLLAFKSSRGRVRGYVRGKGEALEYPFDTDIHAETPIAIQIDQQAVEFRTVGAVPELCDLNINCAGFLFK